MSDEKPTNVSRREFARNLARFLVLGGLTHFSIGSSAPDGGIGRDTNVLGCPGGGEKDTCEIKHVGNLFAEMDYCPGGGPAEDVCRPADGYKDYCPGEKMPEDECSLSGARVCRDAKGRKLSADDQCNIGFPEHDVCNNNIVGSDQCPAMNSTTDVCKPTQSATFDKCYSGLPADDACDSDGGKATDECPGGGTARDTCEKPSGAGDECSDEGGWSARQDSCRPLDDGGPAGLDQCGGLWAADVCYEGTNSQKNNVGGGDVCIGAEALGVKPYGDGADTCLDGSKEQDFCGGMNGDYNSAAKEIDVCLPNKDGEKDDLCDNSLLWEGTPVGSDDYCFEGLPSSDECKPEIKDDDECPGGVPVADECLTGAQLEDECPGGASSVDICMEIVGVSGSDECVPSVVGSDECVLLVLGADEPDGCTIPAAE